MINGVLSHEENLAACALLDPQRAVLDSGHLVSTKDFKDPLLGLIWRMACDAVDSGERLNLPELFNRAGNEHVDRIMHLNEAVGDPFASTVSAKWVRGQAMKHSALDLLERHRSVILDADPLTMGDTLTQCQDEMAMGFTPTESSLPVSGVQSLKVVAERVQERYENKAEVPHLACGVGDLDKLTRGFIAGHSYVLGADTGHGKTVFGTWAAAWAAEKEDARTLYVSLEVPHEDITERIVVARSMVNGDNLMTGMMSDEDVHRVLAAMKGMKRWVSNLHILDRPQVKVNDIGRILRRAKLDSKANPDIKPYRFVVVDYVQLMTGSGGAQTRERELAEIAAGLDGLAKEFGVSLLFLSQLNADRMKRNPPFPTHRAVRGGKALAPPCTAAILMFRPDRDGVLELEIFDRGERKTVNTKDMAMFLLPKNRKGKPGRVHMRMRPEFQKFEQWTNSHYGTDFE